MGITISPWMMAFLMLMTGFAGFVDSAAGGGGLIARPADMRTGMPAQMADGANKFYRGVGTGF